MVSIPVLGESDISPQSRKCEEGYSKGKPSAAHSLSPPCMTRIRRKPR